MHILTWPKIEKKTVLPFVCSSMGKKCVRGGYSCESEKEERQKVEAHREEPEASCLSFVTGTLLSESLKHVACRPFRFSLSNSLCQPAALHVFYPQNLL